MQAHAGGRWVRRISILARKVEKVPRRFSRKCHPSQRTDVRFQVKFQECLFSAFDSAKAVADGAVIWFAKKSVVARATRFAFGTDVTRPYDSKNPEHKGRKVTKSALGERVGNAWAEVVGKVAENVFDVNTR